MLYLRRCYPRCHHIVARSQPLPPHRLHRHRSARGKHPVRTAKTCTSSSPKGRTDVMPSPTRCALPASEPGAVPAPSATPPAVNAVETGHVSQIATILAHDASVPHRRRHHGRRNRGRHKQHSNESASSSLSSVVLDHHVFTAGEWREARFREHPKVAVTISVDHSHRNKTTPCPTGRAEVIAIADTSTMSDLWLLSDFLFCGLKCDLLHPVRLGFSTANRSPISIEGVFFTEITAGSSGSIKTCRSMIYVSSSLKGMYLLYDTMLNLGILPTSFPEAAPIYQPVTDHGPTINVVRVATEGCNAVPKSCDNACSCPQRSTTPKRPTSLPFPCTPDNNELMKTWLLERYSSSTFNMCPHRTLPCMEGPLVEIHIDPYATPKACHTPADIPLHWQKRVYEDLLRDEALGVIERVPYGRANNVVSLDGSHEQIRWVAKNRRPLSAE